MFLLDYLLFFLYYVLPFCNKNWESGIFTPIQPIVWLLVIQFSFLGLMFVIWIVISLEKIYLSIYTIM
jgi:hypothetical protein